MIIDFFNSNNEVPFNSLIMDTTEWVYQPATLKWLTTCTISSYLWTNATKILLGITEEDDGDILSAINGFTPLIHSTVTKNFANLFIIPQDDITISAIDHVGRQIIHAIYHILTTNYIYKEYRTICFRWTTDGFIKGAISTKADCTNDFIIACRLHDKDNVVKNWNKMSHYTKSFLSKFNDSEIIYWTNYMYDCTETEIYRQSIMRRLRKSNINLLQDDLKRLNYMTIQLLAPGRYINTTEEVNNILKIFPIETRAFEVVETVASFLRPNLTLTEKWRRKIITEVVRQVPEELRRDLCIRKSSVLEVINSLYKTKFHDLLKSLGPHVRLTENTRWSAYWMLWGLCNVEYKSGWRPLTFNDMFQILEILNFPKEELLSCMATMPLWFRPGSRRFL